MEELLLSAKGDSVALTTIALSFALCFIFSVILHLVYRKHRSYTALELEPHLLTFVALVTFLIVVVIQDSLMLSLGMVGALSIVRFRSPIKNTLDLGYIFFAVAIGVAFASGKLFIAIFITSSTIVLLYYFLIKRTHRNYSNSNSSRKQDRVWIVQLEHSGTLSEVLSLVHDIAPDGFSYRSGIVELRFSCSNEKINQTESKLTSISNVRITAVSAI